MITLRKKKKIKWNEIIAGSSNLMKRSKKASLLLDYVEMHNFEFISHSCYKQNKLWTQRI